jgi:hypothetical protein
MKHQIPSAAVLIIAALCAPVVVADDTGHRAIRPDTLEWAPVASLPKGAEFAMLEGSLSAAGPFTARLRLPADYRIPPHWHPVMERVTVISGTFYMGLGERFDDSGGMALEAGSMMLMQPETRHFAWTGNEQTVIQLHGTGPWAIHYVDPSDDPRGRR